MKEQTESSEEVSAIVSEESIYSKVARHPFVTGGLVLASAGLAYAAVKTIRSENDVARDVHVETSITIDKSPEELYAFWRDFTNLPLFMKNLESVTELGANRSHWVAKLSNGSLVEWDAEIFNEKQNELIAWRSLEGSEVVNAGTVRFQRAPHGHGTYVRVKMNYNALAGKAGATVARFLRLEPQQLIKEDLRCLKQLLETAEIATVTGQTSGRAEEAKAVAEKSKSLAQSAG